MMQFRKYHRISVFEWVVFVHFIGLFLYGFVFYCINLKNKLKTYTYLRYQKRCFVILRKVSHLIWN